MIEAEIGKLEEGAAMASEVWIVGQHIDLNDERVWEFQGVFDSREKAVAACRTELYFIALAVMNESLAHETIAEEWPGHCFPLAEGLNGE